MRKRLVTVMALVTALLMVSGLAVAQEADTQHDGVVLHGQGKLWARGKGTAVLNMGGTLRMHIRGNVVITDIAGDATIVINGGEAAPPADLAEDGGTTVVLENFTGNLFVKGSHFRVRARGRMVFVARGKGIAFLHGRGVWRTLHNRGRWSGDRLDIAS